MQRVFILFIALFCSTTAISTWRYTSEGYSSEGQACIGNCANDRCLVDWDGHESNCIVTNNQAPRYFTRFGKDCLSNCGYFGYDYEWCFTTFRKDWDHCNSADEHMSIWGLKCIGNCTKHSSGYYWCKVKGGWQFCAPPREGGGIATEEPMFNDK